MNSRRVTVYQCSQCDYQAQSRLNLVIHTSTHTGERSHQCDLCQKHFSRKDSLDRHILTHNDIRRFQCDLCVYNSAIKLNLARHRRTHTGEKPFACDQCDYSSAQNATLWPIKDRTQGRSPFLVIMRNATRDCMKRCKPSFNYFLVSKAVWVTSSLTGFMIIMNIKSLVLCSFCFIFVN